MGIRPRRWHDDNRARQVAAARFEHERAADPVMVRLEVPHLVHRRLADQRRNARKHKTGRRTAGVSVDDFESVIRAPSILLYEGWQPLITS